MKETLDESAVRMEHPSIDFRRILQMDTTTSTTNII